MKLYDLEDVDKKDSSLLTWLAGSRFDPGHFH